MISSQISGDPFMSQRILSSSSLPLRQRSDKPPWCECAPFLIRGECGGEGGKQRVPSGGIGIGVQGFCALPLKQQKQKGEIGERKSSHVPCEKKLPKKGAKGDFVVLYIVRTSVVGWMLSLQTSSLLQDTEGLNALHLNFCDSLWHVANSVLARGNAFLS